MLMAGLGMSAHTALRVKRRIGKIRVGRGRGELAVAENQLRKGVFCGFMVSETFTDDVREREYFLLCCGLLLLLTCWEHFCFP